MQTTAKIHMYNQVKEDEMGRAYSTNGEDQALGRPRRRWVDNIKMDLREIGLN
jgi:NADH:ubiquinone oxidoreductase subunit